MTQRSGILAAGNWIVDRVKLIDTWPSEETLAIISRETQGMGGAPPNVLAGLARLGAKFPLSGAGIVGYDAAGDWILEQCAKLGIDTRLITRTNEGPTSYTDVMNVERTGRRTFFHQRGVNALLGPESIDLASCSARLFHLGYLLLLDRLDRPGKSKGTAAAELLEKRIIGMRQRFGEVQIFARGYANHRVAGNYAFLQSRHSNDRLDGRAWNEASRKCQLLIDDGKKTAARGIDGDDRTVVAAQRLDRRFANDRIVVLGYIILRGISKRWNAVARDGPVPNGSMCGPHASRGPGNRRCRDGEVPCNQCTEHDCKDSIMAGAVSHIIPFWTASALPKRALS